MINKGELLQQVIEKLVEEKRQAELAFEKTKRSVIEAPSAMQSHSDTTRSQTSRLAEEIQRSINEKTAAVRTLQEIMTHLNSLSNIKEVEIGSIVQILTESNDIETFFILPVGGGIEVIIKNEKFLIVTPQAPLIAELIGKRQSNTIRLQIGSLKREITILDIL